MRLFASVCLCLSLCVWTLSCLWSVSVTAQSVPTNPALYRQRRERGWCGVAGSLVGLDDLNCQKVLPSQFDRDWSCPMLSSSINATEYIFSPTANTTAFNLLGALTGLNNTLFTVIDLKRDQTSGRVYGKYISNGQDQTSFQPWSSSKIFASSNAAAHLRKVCGANSGGLAKLQEICANTWLADMLTVITTYDENHNLTSNSLAGYMHSIGGHQAADNLIHSWLKRPQTETFGGNYGEKVPHQICWNFTNPETGEKCDITPDYPNYPVIPNHMSSFSMAEWLRRLVLYREVFSGDRLPFIEWEDIQTLLYGREPGDGQGFWPDLQWGGMSEDDSIYIQTALNQTYPGGLKQLDATTGGNWRIFSKLGYGQSDATGNFEGVLNAYVCVPGSTTDGYVTPDAPNSREFVISIRNFDPDPQVFDSKQQETINTIVQWLFQQP